ncbi:SusC/RagA family TonB-linked outer membrane protein [Sphingobacterium phlebotomi]|uniref:SusC/RagA family TonB-linked outer membrane protein n=1 Tax=Sphingobacterium phlebotomi TaxID=2605433 RepID=A0A5D4HCL8_9SPHI|nr:SusC/RagA family TonB-linked outer membrane protein [Sphingobacterium phlebotomi]TYR37559.1 SusC/RagA family TonB-linked outer membrane protein [Sphingobacterium phlebotomi]
MDKKLLPLLFMITCLIGGAFAQTRQIRGKVTSAVDGNPLLGVSVAIFGTSQVTQTDGTGNYAVQVSGNDPILVFSYMGYAGQRVHVSNQSVVNVQLAADSETLDEVVVTAMGIERQSKSLGYSASILNADELTKARETNLINALAGKAPGVRISSQSGTVGGSSKIVIRGVNSLDGSTPLWVIDGTPVTDGTSAGGTTARNIDFGNRIGDISSDDIASLTVLKGAAATALYGSRAKDGAIIVTTKKGTGGGSPSVTVSSSMRFDNPLLLPDFQNDYAQGNFDSGIGEYVYNMRYLNGWGPKITGQTVKDFLGRDVQLHAYPNNVKDYFNTGYSNINNVSIAGGTESSDYRLGLTHTGEKGIIPNSELKRYNLSLNAGNQFSEKLSSRFSGTYARIDAAGRPAQSSNNPNILLSSVYSIPRVVDINDLKNNFEDPLTGEQIFLGSLKDGNNPYWIMNYNTNDNVVDRFYGSYNLTYKPVDWITISNNLGGDITLEKRSSVVRKGTASVVNGAFYNTELFSRQINNDLIVTVSQDNLVDDFKFSLMLGNNINDRQSESTLITATNLTIDQLWNYPNAANTVPSRAYSKRRIVGVFGDLGMSYKDYLFLNVTGRNDWSSTLPLHSRSYFYPSASGSFIFSDAFEEELPAWLSYGKLRASWAQVGSDMDAYQLDYQYTPVSQVFLQFHGNSNIFPFGPIETAFTGPRILPNYDLVPQRQNSFEIGAELSFLQNRIGVDFNYYNSATKDQLIPIDVAISTGYFSKYVNVGLVRNKGIEVAFNLVPVKTINFNWGIDFNFSKNTQIVEELTDELPEYSAASGWSGLQIKAEKGKSFGLYGKAFQRDAETGKYIVDADNGLRLTEDNKRLGNLYPDWMLGINTNFNYKSFTVSGLVDIRHGGSFYSGTVEGLRTSGMAKETGGDRSQPIIDDALVDKGNGLVQNDVPVESHQLFWSENYKAANTEANIFDASYIKLRELRVSYALPNRLLSGQKVFKSAEIGVEGRNLWLIKSEVPHVDPESNFFGAGSVGEAVEFYNVPSARSFGVNVRLTF